jgi:hypothetical protein
MDACTESGVPGTIGTILSLGIVGNAGGLIIDDIGGMFGTGTFGIEGILGAVGKFDILGSVGVVGIVGIDGIDGIEGGDGNENFGTGGTVGIDGTDVGIFVFKFLYVDVSVKVFL